MSSNSGHHNYADYDTTTPYADYDEDDYDYDYYYNEDYPEYYQYPTSLGNPDPGFFLWESIIRFGPGQLIWHLSF